MTERWRAMLLGDAVEVTMGRQRAPKHAAGSHIVPYLRAANVKAGRLDLSNVLEMNFSREEQEVFALRPGDVLVTEGCGSIRELGASAKWNGELSGVVCFQNTLLRLRAVPGMTEPTFVNVWAQYAHAHGLFAKVASGTNIFHIGSTRAKSIPMLLPPAVEQRRIADLVAACDDAVAGARAVVGTASSALERFLGGVPSDSPRRFLGDLAVLRSGPSWSSSQESIQPSPGASPVIGITNTRPDGRLDMTTRRWIVGLSDTTTRLTAASLVMIRTNGNRSRIGNVYRVTPDAVGCAVSAFQIAIEPFDSRDSEYLYWHLRSPRAQRSISSAANGTTGLGNIAVRWLRLLPVAWPSSSARRDFVKTANALQAVVDAAQNEVTALERLRHNLLSDVLCGRHQIPRSYDSLLRRVP